MSVDTVAMAFSDMNLSDELAKENINAWYI